MRRFHLRRPGLLPKALLFALAIALCLTSPLPAAELAPARGRLLVAEDSMQDPRFRQTVILLLQHDRRGTVGLILNRPTEIALRHALPEDAAFSGRPETVSFGGPVALKTMLVLLHTASPPSRSTSIIETVHVTGVEELAAWLGGAPAAGDDFRIFMGRAGWAPGQLDAELARGDWRVYPAGEETLFGEHPETLWFEIQDGRQRDWI